jgi:adenylate cyclase
MAAEIERKFLIVGDSWKDGCTGLRMAQGYLSLDPDRTVRVRLAGEDAWITIKGRTEGITRTEFEYSIPPNEAKSLLAMCLPSVIDKTRHLVRFGGHVWEIDVFHGENEGLTVAEVELESEGETPEMPPWTGLEVSEDVRYFNAHLASHPYSTWRTDL